MPNVANTVLTFLRENVSRYWVSLYLLCFQ